MAKNLKQDSHLLRVSFNETVNHLLRNLSCGLYSRPEKVFIIPTLRCNLRCKHCYRVSYAGGELTTEKWKGIIIKLKQWLGYFLLVFTEGEPLMREDLFEIINFARKQGIFTILSTNGTLIDNYAADRLVESGLDIICISLDGFKETHEFLRGDGVYNKVINAIGYLKNRIKLHITTTIMNYNLDEILDLVKFATINRIGISFQGLLWRFNSQIVYADPQNNEQWPKDIAKVERIISEIILRKKKSKNIRNSVRHLRFIKSSFRHPYYNHNYHCQVDKKNFVVSSNGDVRLCGNFEPIGNLISESPKTIWNSKKAAFIRGQIKRCNLRCAILNCHFYENILEKFIRFKNTF